MTSEIYLSTAQTTHIIQERFPELEDQIYLKNLNLRVFNQDELHLDAIQASKASRQSLLLRIVKLSKDSKEYKKAAANAATALVMAGFSFSNEDLKGVRIPYANLSGGVFERTQFQGADLTDVNLTDCCLNQANFTGSAQVKGIQLGLEFKDLQNKEPIQEITFSADNRYFLSKGPYQINIWDKFTGAKITTEIFREFAKILFFQKGKFLLTCSYLGPIALHVTPSLNSPRHLLTLDQPLRIIEEAQLTYDETYLVVHRKSSSSSFVHILKFTSLAETVPQEQTFPNITLHISGEREFPNQFEVMRVSTKSDLLATISRLGASYCLQIWSIPNLTEVSSHVSETKILDILFFPREECLVVVKEKGLYSWHWDGDQEPQKLFQEDFCSSSQLKLIPYGSEFIFGYLKEGTHRHKQENDNMQSVLPYVFEARGIPYDATRNLPHKKESIEQLCFRNVNGKAIGQLSNVNGKAISQLSLDTLNDSFRGKSARFNISSDGLTTILALDTTITLLPTSSLFKNVSRFKRDLNGGEFQLEKHFVVRDDQNRYLFDAKNGQFIREELLKENAAKPTKFDNYSLHINGANVELKNCTSNQIIKLPFTINKNDQIQLIPSSSSHQLIAYVNSCNLTLLSIDSEGEGKECKSYVWPHNSTIGRKKLLFSKNFQFLLLLTLSNFFIVDIDNFLLKTLDTEKIINNRFVNRFINFENSVFDVSNNLCCVFYKNHLVNRAYVLLWDLKTEKLLDQVKVPYTSFNVIFSQDGSLLACVGLNGVRVWQIANQTLKLLWRVPSFFEAQETQVNLSDWDPNSRHLFKNN